MWFRFICDGVSNVDGYKTKTKKLDTIWVVCNKLTAIWAPKCQLSWQFSETYGVTSYGSGWRKDVVKQCLEVVNLDWEGLS